MAEDENEKDYQSVKVTLIGGTAVGKTCIIRRYSDNIYVENPPSTSGGSYSEKSVTIDNKNIHLNLWDTAGQERFRALGKHFYKDAYIIILVYDITQKSSFQEIKDVWYPNVKQNGEKYSVLALVGNKSDLYEDEQVTENEAKEYAKEIGAIFMLVSAKNGDNVNNLFDDVLRKYLGDDFVKKVDEMKKDKGEVTKIKKEKSGKNQKGKKKKEKGGGFC